jgi:hypothetical protein
LSTANIAFSAQTYYNSPDPQLAYFPFTLNPTGLARDIFFTGTYNNYNSYGGFDLLQDTNNYTYVDGGQSIQQNYFYPTTLGAWAQKDFYGPFSYSFPYNSVQTNYDWCHGSQSWLLRGTTCPDIDQCETDGQMKVDFVNFVLNITGQAEVANPNPNTNQGFCAIDLQPIFDDSAAAKTARDDWATAEFVSATVGGQKVVRLPSLQEYTGTTPSGGGGTGGTADTPVVITWVLSIAFSNIQNLDAFKAQLVIDFSTALECDPSRIVINFVGPAMADPYHDMATSNDKTQIKFTITSTTDPLQPTAVGLSVILFQQWHDPNSAIYSGTYTQLTDTTANPGVTVLPSGSAFSLCPSPLSFIVLMISLFLGWKY